MKRVFTLLMVLMAMATGTRMMAQEAYAVYKNGTLTFYYDNLSGTRNGDVYNWDDAYDGYMCPQWSRDHRDDIVRAVFDSSFKNARPTEMQSCFYKCKNLTTIIGIENVNTSQVTDFSHMFYECEKLQSSLDLSGWNTSNVTKMSHMFFDCEMLPSVNVSGWDTSNVTTIEGMFDACTKLTILDVGNWDTSNVENMRIAFSLCFSLEHLDVSKWNTFYVTEMDGMFDCCQSLKTLDLSNWNTSGVINMSYMFAYCTNLTQIFCGNDWTTINVSDSEDMFWGCTNLVGGKGTKYNVNHVDASYAHLDGGPSNPGYFSKSESYKLWVNGIKVTTANCYNLPYEGVSFEPSTKTLILNNLNMYSASSTCIDVSSFSGDLTIQVNGTCTLKAKKKPLYVFDSKVTITGPGKLELISESDYGITVSYSSKLIFENADVNVQGYDCAIYGALGNEVIVKHSSLEASSQTRYYSTVYQLSRFTLENSEYKDVNAGGIPGTGQFCTFFGKNFYYDTYNRVLCYEGQYYDNDWGFYDDLMMTIWCYRVLVGPMSAPTDIHTATLQNEQDGAVYNLNGQRVEDSYRGIVIKNGKKFVK